ncbi:GntR family transcriptional regulator, partial [Escherichia coli]|nr:GntR family transcriptional regulator [Escherichia coli]
MSSRRFGTQSLMRLLGHWQQEHARTPIWRQLADALRLLILDGRLALDTRLPGERELATSLGVSRTTISSALAHLRDAGYLESRLGSGSRIILPDSRAIPTRAVASEALDLSTAALGAGPEIFQAYTHALTALSQHLTHTGYDQAGLQPLREAIASRYTARGLPTRPEEIMVVNGAV